MKLFQHKHLVAFYRANTIANGKLVTVAENLSWRQALYIQEQVPRVSIRFSHHEERLIPDAVNAAVANEVQS